MPKWHAVGTRVSQLGFAGSHDSKQLRTAAQQMRFRTMEAALTATSMGRNGRGAGTTRFCALSVEKGV